MCHLVLSTLVFSISHPLTALVIVNSFLKKHSIEFKVAFCGRKIENI